MAQTVGEGGPRSHAVMRANVKYRIGGDAYVGPKGGIGGNANVAKPVYYPPKARPAPGYTDKKR